MLVSFGSLGDGAAAKSVLASQCGVDRHAADPLTERALDLCEYGSTLEIVVLAPGCVDHRGDRVVIRERYFGLQPPDHALASYMPDGDTLIHFTMAHRDETGWSALSPIRRERLDSRRMLKDFQ